MVQLRARKDGGIDLVNRDHTVSLSNTQIVLKDGPISSPGEYEAEGVEVVYGTQAALIVWEKLQIAYIFQLEKPTSFEKSQFTPCNILVVDSSVTGIDKQKVTEVLEAYDPSIVVFGANADTSGIQDSLKIEQKDSLKISDNSLPEEGRELYQLSS